MSLLHQLFPPRSHASMRERCPQRMDEMLSAARLPPSTERCLPPTRPARWTSRSIWTSALSARLSSTVPRPTLPWSPAHLPSSRAAPTGGARAQGRPPPLRKKKAQSRSDPVAPKPVAPKPVTHNPVAPKPVAHDPVAPKATTYKPAATGAANHTGPSHMVDPMVIDISTSDDEDVVTVLPPPKPNRAKLVADAFKALLRGARDQDKKEKAEKKEGKKREKDKKKPEKKEMKKEKGKALARPTLGENAAPPPADTLNGGRTDDDAYAWAITDSLHLAAAALSSSSGGGVVLEFHFSIVIFHGGFILQAVVLIQAGITVLLFRGGVVAAAASSFKAAAASSFKAAAASSSKAAASSSSKAAASSSSKAAASSSSKAAASSSSTKACTLSSDPTSTRKPTTSIPILRPRQGKIASMREDVHTLAATEVPAPGDVKISPVTCVHDPAPETFFPPPPEKLVSIYQEHRLFFCQNSWRWLCSVVGADLILEWIDVYPQGSTAHRDDILQRIQALSSGDSDKKWNYLRQSGAVESVWWEVHALVARVDKYWAEHLASVIKTESAQVKMVGDPDPVLWADYPGQGDPGERAGSCRIQEWQEAVERALGWEVKGGSYQRRQWRLIPARSARWTDFTERFMMALGWSINALNRGFIAFGRPYKVVAALRGTMQEFPYVSGRAAQCTSNRFEASGTYADLESVLTQTGLSQLDTFNVNPSMRSNMAATVADLTRLHHFLIATRPGLILAGGRVSAEAFELLCTFRALNTGKIASLWDAPHGVASPVKVAEVQNAVDVLNAALNERWLGEGKHRRGSASAEWELGSLVRAQAKANPLTIQTGKIVRREEEPSFII
ncbi:hypothetical protein DFH09DRAFT_1078744 [Mycena vulgaris]|nr:hypothetical protein DFH09DRAFT_1078744 [Mycena vulgaris]